VVFDTTILGSNPSAPAKKMNIFSAKIKSIKKKLFPFYKSKELNLVFDILEEAKPKERQVAMFVGGCVRKYLDKHKVDDIDIATIFTPEEIKIKFKKIKEVRVVETGVEHGTVTLLLKDLKLEITTLRKDITTDGRHAEVAFTNDWKEDSERRDFTINAIYMDRKGKIFDPQSGVKDLKNKIIKFIGDPHKRIEEDYLRIIRFIRFNLHYDTEIEQLTLDAVKLNLNGIKNISKERVLQELFKILNLQNFIKINNSKDLKDVFCLIFPEFKYLDRLDKFEFLKKQFKISKDFILAILLIDETNNHEYFCHKYKTSNIIKNKLELLSKCLIDKSKDKDYFTKNLKKNIYFEGKHVLLEFNALSFLIDKKITLQEYSKIKQNIEKISIPKFPYDGKYLITQGLPEGKKIGYVLEKLESMWIQNNYSLSEPSVTEVIKKAK
jgi:tRNA nucleotidyltransferase/poly(A) polymerase